MHKKIIIISLLFVCTACTNQALNQKTPPPNSEDTTKEEPVVGGTCAYKKIAGSCRITYLSKTTASIAQAAISGGPGYEGYEVKYKFTPQNPNLIDNEDILSREHIFLLANSWYPGEKYLEKYKIAEGNVFDCELAKISKGTCTPNILSINEINNADYFETK
ncbi:hypothetical protein A2331_01555 [Candidatus Falkowbacteria bacterium RIFOXYB2_FULL_34_18]|uniref:Lipoprotein n=1 Tax=Candidatus Falkowbacteria bacterium RIFOXYD2_FULL_34_120 TaxID=1798007 RepID=A0A1F5TQ76_9BACT|nr:MAG: hypothetical protein A2331_01555 [Candidatus Falkowbacteria bacterium RIFOXYB2_FULL_34_18]OGF29300.1 MAG: hypothetical protein A2500_05435 [Candidatus Falkowbacteria bacterium RIFOXYC12_FULL_34_55]OGF36416.1 MAG: hypothetical protein A2466_01095 [Candidatus Falkowbacteria bacterium RIFOXYC2_FULL_34_220]OGF38895.1 MAG: hypothetical protein A2515_05855 [Candidatus Falkowbacteria bacterium RIFOXYD12_FULL_34_57]OGF40914.1 MAG: hypothetical protein A2531_04080 [Candidatus Falkowbacteria bact